MPVNPRNYDHHGHGNDVIIIWCPTYVGERFAHFDRNPETGSWVIRDYIARQRLSHDNSHLEFADIERETQRDEFPPYYPYSENQDWEAYLRLRSLAVSKQYRLHYSTAAPNRDAGDWQQM
jgi:hypothetical protein